MSFILGIFEYNLIINQMAQDLLGNTIPTPLQFFSKEIMILQQSQSKLALEFLTSQGITPSTEVLWKVTELFVECCLYKETPELREKKQKLDKWIAKQKK
jgi:hypothetical protein